MISVHNIEIWRRLSVAFKYQQGKMILHFLDYFKCQPNLWKVRVKILSFNQFLKKFRSRICLLIGVFIFVIFLFFNLPPTAKGDRFQFINDYFSAPPSPIKPPSLPNVTQAQDLNWVEQKIDQAPLAHHTPFWERHRRQAINPVSSRRRDTSWASPRKGLGFLKNFPGMLIAGWVLDHPFCFVFVIVSWCWFQRFVLQHLKSSTFSPLVKLIILTPLGL